MSKITLDLIQEELTANNWTILTNTYTNLNTIMHFRCPNGHDVNTSWGILRKKMECPICAKNQEVLIEERHPKPVGAKRIIALDQATHITGYSVFDNTTLIHTGTFQTSQDDEIERIAAVKNWLLSMIMSWSPDIIALEGIQFQEESSGRKMGVTVFETLARLQGVLQLVCYENKIQCEICPTNTWRHEVGVKGKTRADRKKSMQLLVKQNYGIDVSDDIADAIGIGRYIANRLNKSFIVENWE